MNASPDPDLPADTAGATTPARHWSRSEVFCIHSYAGEAGPPCGWHGLLRDTTTDAHGLRRCPRCGRATVMRIENR